MIAYQNTIRDMIAELEAEHGVAVALPITEPLLRAYEAVGRLNRLMEAIHGETRQAAKEQA